MSELEQMIAQLFRDIDKWFEDFQNAERCIPPAPYGEAERRLAFEKLNLRAKMLNVKANVVHSLVQSTVEP